MTFCKKNHKWPNPINNPICRDKLISFIDFFNFVLLIRAHEKIDPRQLKQWMDCWMEFGHKKI